MKARFSLLLFLISVPFSTSKAESNCQGKFSTPQIILKCIEQNAPQLLKGRALDQEADSLPKQAKQWMNPSFGFQGLYGSTSNPNGSNVETSLLFPIDLWGSLPARVRTAELEKQEQHLSTQIDRQNLLVVSYLALHRVRQINQQMTSLAETRTSLEKLIQFFLLRPRLTPEQEASREALKLALQETQVRQELFQQESHGIVHDIEIQVDALWEPTATNLPQPPSQWPKLGAFVTDTNLHLKKAKVAIEKEDSNLELIGKLNRPIPWVGPMVGWSEVQHQSGFTFGFGIQFPLPILESYSGSKELAEKKIDTAKTYHLAESRELGGELAHNKEIYEASVQALASLDSFEVSRKRVARVEKLFKQGLISGPSYLEVLRQDFSLRQTRDVLEHRALSAWCQLQIMQNRLQECFL